MEVCMAKLYTKAVKTALLVICLAVVPLAGVLAGSDSQLVATDPAGVAIKGYDTVAYFTEGKAIKGKPEFAFAWDYDLITLKTYSACRPYIPFETRLRINEEQWVT